MRFFDYIKLAFMNLWRRKLRSALTIFAVVIGAASVLTMITLVSTASTAIKQQLEGMDALRMVRVVTVEDTSDMDFFSTGYNSQDGTKIDDSAAAKVEKIEHVVGVSKEAGIWSFKSAHLDGGEKKTEARITAFEPNEVNDLELAAGENLKAGEKSVVVIGMGVAKKFGYDAENVDDLIGKKIIFLTSNNFTGIGVDPLTPPTNLSEEENRDWWDKQSQQTYEIPATIIGVQTSGIGSDDRAMYTTLDWARDLMMDRHWEQDQKENEKLGRAGQNFEPVMKLVENDMLEKQGYQSLTVLVDSVDNIKTVREEIEKMKYGTITAEDMLAQINKLFLLLGVVFGLVGGIALFVATLGIINTMVMAIYERTREIGIMRACGATKGVIWKLYTLEASLIGFMGGVIGVGILFILVKLGNTYGNEFFEAQQINLQNIISPPSWLVFGVIGFTTLVGAIAGVYPAFRAANLDPVEALKYE